LACRSIIRSARRIARAERLEAQEQPKSNMTPINIIDPFFIMLAIYLLTKIIKTEAIRYSIVKKGNFAV
jgi:hypothetical protein